MTRDEAIDAGLEMLKQAEVDALGGAYDSGVASVPVGSGGGFTQADVDAAVVAAVSAAQGVDAADLAAKLADLAALDAQALADAQAAGVAAVADVQAALDAMTAKEQMEESAVADVGAKIAAVQASFDAIKALLFPPAP